MHVILSPFDDLTFELYNYRLPSLLYSCTSVKNKGQNVYVKSP